MGNGWVKLYRQTLEWEWFSYGHAFKLFCYLMLKASHNGHNFRGEALKPGQLPFGRDKASIETGISTQQIRTLLKKLKSTNEITIKPSRQGSIITILNWEKYQMLQHTVNQQVTSEQPTTNQQVTTTKNEKNEKNEKNTLSTPKHDALINEIVETWNKGAKLNSFPQITKTGKAWVERKKKIKSWLTEMDDIEKWRCIFNIAASKGFTSADGRLFVPNLDFVLRGTNPGKFYEESLGDKL